MSTNVILDSTNKAFAEEGVRHSFCIEGQLLKRSDVVFKCTLLFNIFQMTQMMSACVKMFIKICNKLGPSNITLVGIFAPFPPLPVL
jgi:hypothetical protein